MRCNDPNYCGDWPVYNHFYMYQGLMQCEPFSPGCNNDTMGICKKWWWKNADAACNVNSRTGDAHDVIEASCTGRSPE